MRSFIEGTRFAGMQTEIRKVEKRLKSAGQFLRKINIWLRQIITLANLKRKINDLYIISAKHRTGRSIFENIKARFCEGWESGDCISTVRTETIDFYFT